MGPESAGSNLPQTPKQFPQKSPPDIHFWFLGVNFCSMKRLLLLLLAFGALTCSAQFPHNGGFEDSVMVSNGYIPSNWSVDGFGFGYSNDAHSGSKAARRSPGGSLLAACICLYIKEDIGVIMERQAQSRDPANHMRIAIHGPRLCM